MRSFNSSSINPSFLLPSITAEYKKTVLGVGNFDEPKVSNLKSLDKNYCTTKSLLEYIESLNQKALFDNDGSSFPSHEPSVYGDIYEKAITELNL